MQALPLAAVFLFLEAAAGGTVALLGVYLRNLVTRGFFLFTAAIFWLCALLAAWLSGSFPPARLLGPDQRRDTLFSLAQNFSIAFLLVFGLYIVLTRLMARPPHPLLGGLSAVLACGALVLAALEHPTSQLLGLGALFAVLAGALALGSALAALSLGHWYLVTPGLSTRPLIQLTLLCLGALLAQVLLLPTLLVLFPGSEQTPFSTLLNRYGLFFGVRVIFGLVVPVAAAILAWRTARIRSLDSATGLLYILAVLVLAGEITARTLFFLTDLAT